jgi:hypothetical protein
MDARGKADNLVAVEGNGEVMPGVLEKLRREILVDAVVENTG